MGESLAGRRRGRGEVWLGRGLEIREVGRVYGV